MSLQRATIGWRNWREREVEWFMCFGEQQKWRRKSGEEEADVGGLHCYPGPWRCPWLLLTLKTTRMLRVGYNTWGHVGVREPCYHHTMLIWVVFTATQSHGNIRAQTVTKDHIALLQLGSMLIYIVHVTAKGHWIICVLKSKSHAELSLSSADPGKVGSCSRRVGPDDPSTGRAGTGELILTAWMQES